MWIWNSCPEEALIRKNYICLDGRKTKCCINLNDKLSLNLRKESL